MTRRQYAVTMQQQHRHADEFLYLGQGVRIFLIVAGLRCGLGQSRQVLQCLARFVRPRRIGACGQAEPTEETAAPVEQVAAAFGQARALLLDAFVEGYGGGGHVFDWSLIPPDLPGHWILSGGLHAGNVAAALEKLRPVAVDVSSGVEVSKGIKDHDRITAFVAAVRAADAANGVI